MDFINGWFGARGLETVRYGGAGSQGELTSLVVGVGSGEPRILLHGHVDVVPGEEGQFEAREEHEELYGRGVYDMKGALAAMMYAVEDLRSLGCEATVELLIVADEEQEHGGPNGAEVLIGHGHTGDFLITGEPTDFHIGTLNITLWSSMLRSAGSSSRRMTVKRGANFCTRTEAAPFGVTSSEASSSKRT